MEILRRVERNGVAVGLNLNAECAEHALGVVAGRSRLDNGRLTLGVQTGQQDCTFQLSGCHRQAVFNAVQLAREQGQRAEIVVLALDGRAHLAQRLHHAAHWALLDGRVAAHGNGERLTGQNAAQQAGGRAGVAGVQRFFRRFETVQANAFHDDFVVSDVDLNTHFTEAVDGGQAVLAHQKTGDVSGAVGQCAEHNSTVRDGFVAGHGNFTAQRAARLNLHGFVTPFIRWARNSCRLL